MKYTEIEKRIARDIGLFCFKKDESVTNALNELKLLNITDLAVEDMDDDIRVTITLGRPGLLIGCNGTNIEALQKYLSEKNEKTVKIHIVENCLSDYLTAFNVFAHDFNYDYDEIDY